MGLVVPWPVGYFRIRDWTRVSCTGRQILYHWATREAQKRKFQNRAWAEEKFRNMRGLCAFMCLSIPPTQFLRHWQPPCQRGLKAFRRSTHLHVVCIWTKHLRFQNVTVLCILTTEWKNWGTEHAAPPGFLGLSCWHFEMENSLLGVLVCALSDVLQHPWPPCTWC